MASSRLGSRSYGCVLRDRNLQDREREREAVFQNNLKDLVRGHLHNCISYSASRGSEATLDENSCDRDCWENDNNTRKNRNFCRFSDKEETQFEPSCIGKKQSRILDRWAAQQAQEMISTIERQTHEAELLALFNSHPVSTRASTFQRENSPTPSDNSSIDVPNLKASSLVQKWKDFEAETKVPSTNRCGSCNSNSTDGSSRLNSPTVEMGSSIEEPSSADVSPGAPVAPEESFTDLESDRNSPSLQEPNSDSGESDKGRVADIIKRWTLANQSQTGIPSWNDEIEALSSDNHSVSDQGEQRGFFRNGNRPCVRGRQAILDLLSRVENERQMELSRLVERRAVSQFSQRGRIQSLLKLRLLQCRNQNFPSLMASRFSQPQGTKGLLKRAIYCPSGEQEGQVTLNREADLRSNSMHLENDTLERENSVMSNQLTSDDIQHHEVVTRIEEGTLAEHPSVPVSTEDSTEEADPSADVTWQETALDVSDTDWLRPENTTRTNHDWVEETEPDDRPLTEANDGSWLFDFSPPQRDWENCREAWYQEVLATSENEEIKNLLQRRTVSTFLGSDFRERMDRLILSQLQRRRHEFENSEEEYENHIEQLPLPTGLQSWDHYQNHEVVQDSDQVASTSFESHLPSRSYYHDNQQSSIVLRHSSVEMELIYDLRGYMVQLHNEIFEMRKSIDNCMEMQVKLQNSIKHEVAAAVCNSIRECESIEPLQSVPKARGNCFICDQMQIDSLFYRCGHMCACFKCAHELQWSSGRCPICQAPIMDVVQPHPN